MEVRGIRGCFVLRGCSFSFWWTLSAGLVLLVYVVLRCLGLLVFSLPSGNRELGFGMLWRFDCFLLCTIV